MERIRPKVGFLPFESQWFKDVGLTARLGQNGGAGLAFADAISAEARRAEAVLAQQFEVFSYSPVSTSEEVLAGVRSLLRREIDLLVVCPLVWAEDPPLLKALPLIRDLPVVLWCYSPYLQPPARETLIGYLQNSGMVGALQFAGALRQCQRSFEFVLGSPQEPEVIDRIRIVAEAAAVRNRLRHLTIALLPSHSDLMTDIYVDEATLRQEFGVTVRYAAVTQLDEAARGIPELETKEFVRKLTERYPVDGADEESIFHSARASLGLKRLVEQLRVDAVSFNDTDCEVHRVLGLRPGFYPWSFSIGKVALGLEGDLPTMTCLLILALLSGEPVLFGEYLNFDKVENVTVLHHTGAQDPGLADDRWSPVVTSDLEYSSSSNRFRGATLELAARPGRVTILSLLAARDRFIMVAAGGESLGGPPRIPGSPHVIFRPDLPLEEYFRRATQAGIGHHCAVVHGDFRPQVQALSRMLQVEHVSIG